MQTYSIRIVLRGSGNFPANYRLLHLALAKEGFVTTITGEDGVVSKLPPGEYRIHSALSVQQVYSKARLAANSVDSDNGVVVSEIGKTIYGGLEPFVTPVNPFAALRRKTSLPPGAVPHLWNLMGITAPPPVPMPNLPSWIQLK